MKSNCTRTAAILAMLFCSYNGYPQQKHPFDLPATIPMPEWVKLADWDNPNVYRIDSLIEVYKNVTKEKPGTAKEPQEGRGSDADGFREDPYINAYIRWRNSIAPFIQENGSIKYDAGYHKQQLLNSIEKQGQKKSGRNERTTAGAANWTLLGPVETYRSGGGGLRNYQTNIYCIAIAPSNPAVLYACSEPGTMYRSADKGLHWVSVSDTLYSCGSKSIAVNPLNENIVYTYDGGSSTLLKTINGGASWSALSAYTGGGGNSMAINRNTGRILITGSTSIYYSDNAGASWTMAAGSTVTGSLYDIMIGAAGTDTVYAAGSTSGNILVLLRSTNGGSTFTDVTGAIAGTGTSGARLGGTVANSNYVYCVNLGNTTPPRVIKSTDRGAAWSVTATSTSTTLTGSSATTGLGMSNGQGYYDLGIVVSPANANTVIVGTTTTYKSTDGGVNFNPLGGYSGPFALHPDIQQAVALGGDAYIATDGGVNHSTDFFTNTANWSVRNNGLRSADYWGFGQGWDEDIVVGGRYHNGNSGQYEYYGAGNALSLGGGEDATGHVFHGNPRTVGFRDIGNLILPATLTGAVQSAANVPNSVWPQDDYYGMFSSELSVGPVYSSVSHLGKDSILWKSANSGASYTALHNFGAGNKVWRFEISRNNPKVIYVCANNGLYKSTDARTSWSTLTLPVAWSSYNTDVAINPLNDSEVYVCMANAASANKVFRSTNGGTTWTNITGTTLAGKKVAFLQYHGGTNGGIYAVTNTRPSNVYYRDNTMGDWVDFSAGLPASLQARVGALIFYRDNKMRLAGNCSMWESPLYATGAPVAQPMVDKRYTGCSRDTFNFYDYSMYDQAGATRLWTFPGALWVSSTSARAPKVVYPSPGYYTVSLKITDAAARTHTRTIDSMVIVSDDYCSADTVAGKCLQLNGTSQTVNLGIADINSNTFSISCWIQPKGNQSSFSQIISHGKYPGSGSYGFGLGFKFNGYTPNLILCYTDSMVNYSGSSSLICDSTKWNHVVLTYSPAGVVLYLNGIADTVNSYSPMPVIDLSQSPFLANLDVHSGQGSKFNGKIDEVKIYNYALTQNEVREKMHLITDPATEAGLIKYYQFNQYDLANGSLYDVKGNFNTFVPSANIVTSTAPVSSGRVFRNPSVTGGGLNTFGPAGVDLHLPAIGTYPDGEVVAFHLFSGPDTKPDTRATVPGYFILNNYGSNAIFTQPDSFILKNLPVSYTGFTAGDFRLFKRATGDFGNTWSAELDSAEGYSYMPGNSNLSWHAGSYLTSLNSQLIIVKNDSTYVSGAGVENLLSEQWSISEIYPNPSREWCRLSIHAPMAAVAEAHITLTDVNGREILKIAEGLSKQDNMILMRLPALPAGTYLVNVEVPGKISQVRKLLVE